MLSGHKHFVFDLDGTVLSSGPFYLSILERLCERYQVELTLADRRLALGLPARKFFTEKLPPHVQGPAFDFLVQQSIIELPHIPVFDGMQDLLRDLRKRGCRVALWTSRDKASTEALLTLRGIHDHFDLKVTYDCISRHKPDPEGLIHIAGKFGCDVRELVMVGDHDVDVQAAHSAGSKPIRANWHGLTPGFVCPSGAPTFETLDEFRRNLVHHVDGKSD
jgi:HAD superfamily hydrolase (TIGR01509 family)